MGRCKDGGNWRVQAASVSHILYLFGAEILIYEKKSEEVLKSICGNHVLFFSVKVRTKNQRLRRTWFGYNNNEMLRVKCFIFFNLRFYWLQPAQQVRLGDILTAMTRYTRMG